MATYTSNYAWTKPEGSDQVDIGVLNNNLDSQDAIVHNAYMQLAPVFSSASTYAVDDVVLYSNNLYKCHTAVTVAGDWTGATNWTQVKVSDICGGGGGGGTSDYTQLSNKPSVNNVTLVGNKTGTQLGLQNTGEASIGVEELIRDTVGRVGKNLMVYPYYEGTEEEQGVTFTDNGDGTITLSGTSSASAYHFLERDSSLYLKAGDYILGGGILNAWLYLYTNSGTEIAHTNNSDTSVKVTIPSDGYYRVSLVIPANKTFSNVTCYPMIRHAEVVDDTYEAYHKPIEDEMLMQVTTMPPASADNVGKIVQYVGGVDPDYDNGLFYKCVGNGIYSWQPLTVQSLSNQYSGPAILDIGYAFSLAGARSMYTELKNAMSADATEQYKRTLTAGATMVKVEGFNYDIDRQADDKYGVDAVSLITDVYTDTFGLMASNIVVSKTDPETHISYGTYNLYVFFPEQAADVEVLIILRKAKV